MNKKSKDSSKSKKNSLPHDALIKKVIENPIAAKEFLEEYLPESFKNVVNLETIKVEKESFVEKHLTRQLSDIVLSAVTKDNQQAFIYTLIEAQVTPVLDCTQVVEIYLLLLERHIKDKDNLPNKDVNRVMRTIADSYKEEWFNKGLVQGIEQGIEEGEEKKAIETICLNLTWNLSLSLL